MTRMFLRTCGMMSPAVRTVPRWGTAPPTSLSTTANPSRTRQWLLDSDPRISVRWTQRKDRVFQFLILLVPSWKSEEKGAARVLPNQDRRMDAFEALTWQPFGRKGWKIAGA